MTGTVKLTQLEELQLVFQHVQTGPVPTEGTAAPMEVQQSGEQQSRETEESQAKYHRSAAKRPWTGQGTSPESGTKVRHGGGGKGDGGSEPDGGGLRVAGLGRRGLGPKNTSRKHPGVAGATAAGELAKPRRSSASRTWRRKMRLIARVALRHEDELSQLRTERVFVLTSRPRRARCWIAFTNWRLSGTRRRRNDEVDCPLRLMLFLGLLEHWKLRLRALEASEELRNLMVQQGLATLEEGVPELQWGYQRWNPTLEKLEPVQGATPMHQSQVVETLVQLESTISSPNALVQFSCYAQAGREPGRGHHHLPHGSWPAGSHGQPGLGHDDESMRADGHEADRPSHPASSAGPATRREGVGGEIPSIPPKGKERQGQAATARPGRGQGRPYRQQNRG